MAVTSEAVWGSQTWGVLWDAMLASSTVSLSSGREKASPQGQWVRMWAWVLESTWLEPVSARPSVQHSEGEWVRVWEGRKEDLSEPAKARRLKMVSARPSVHRSEGEWVRVSGCMKERLSEPVTPKVRVETWASANLPQPTY